GACQLDATTVALEQRDSELVLEPPYLLAERGLRDMQSFRRATEVKLLGHRDEVLDEPEVEPIHRRSLLIGGRLGLDFAHRLAHPWHRRGHLNPTRCNCPT